MARRHRVSAHAARVRALVCSLFAFTLALAGASPGAGAASIPLVPGWNLVSIPEEPADPDPAVVLAGISGAYDEVWAYDGCDQGDPWQRYAPADPGGSDLAAIDHRRGLWIHATAPATLTTIGTVPVAPQLPVCAGWNLIGHPRDLALPVKGNLIAIDGQYTRVYGWDPADPGDPWAVHDPAAPGWTRDLAQMAPGAGYWLLATADTTLTFGAPDPPPVIGGLNVAEGDTFTAPFDVAGNVTADGEVTWELQYRRKDGTGWTTFAGGAGGVVGGRFDPTLLKNDMYEVRLLVTDVFGQTTEQVVTVLVDGQAKVGLFSVSFLDLSFLVPGTVPLDVVRTYDNRDKSVGDFGHGWTLSVSQATFRNNRTPGLNWFVADAPLPFPFPCTSGLETAVHFTEVRLGEDEVYRFAFKADFFGLASVVSGGCDGVARYEQTGGRQGATLSIQDSTDVHWPAGSDELLTFDRSEIYDPQTVLLETPEGMRVLISKTEGVRQIEDPNGNRIDIFPSGIIHSGGRSVLFDRDAEGRVVQITDPAGGALTYTYDARGDLASVTDRSGAITRFTYDVDHDLVEIIDPRGVKVSRQEFDADGRLVAIVDPDGERVEITHDLDNRVETVKDCNGNVTLVEYDATGNVVSETNALGGVTTWTHDLAGNELSRTDPLGHVTTATYDSRGNRLTVTRPLGITSTWTYDLKNRTRTVANPLGQTSTLHYDDDTGNLVLSEDPLGNDTAIAYDFYGQITSSTNPAGATTTMTWSTDGNLLTQTLPGGLQRGFTYDANGNLLTATTTRTDGQGQPVVAVESFEYDANDRLVKHVTADGATTYREYDATGRVTAVIDPLGRRTEQTYDAQGRMVRVDYPDGSFATMTYDANGNRTALTDPTGHTTTWTYDALNRRTGASYDDGTSEVWVYDAAGRLLSETDRAGATTTHEYDDAGRRTKTTDALGHETTWTYDAAGRVTTMTDALARVTGYTYDARGRQVGVTWPDGTTTTRTYDAAGNLASVTDELGQVTTFAYDAAGRCTQVTDPLGGIWAATYDEMGNTLTLTDALGRVTSFTYDANGRRTSRTLPLGMTETFAFDARGHLVTHTDFDGDVTSYDYDEQSRLTAVSYDDGNAVTYTYDGLSRVETVTDPRGVTTYTRDGQGRLAGVTHPDGSVLSYTYDVVGRLAALTAPAGTTSYTWDALSRLATVTGADGGVTTYHYDAVGNRTLVEHANGTTTQYTWDDRDRLAAVAHRRADTTPLAVLTYTRDAAGRRTALGESSGRSVTWDYDALGRLVEETISDPGDLLEPLETLGYTYDAVGNRLTKTANAGLTTYLYDDNDRLVSEDGPDGLTTYAFDDAGQVTARVGPADTAGWTWDARGRLVHFERGVEAVDYTYDAAGALVGYSVGGDERRLLLDDALGFTRPIEERDGGGVLVAQHTLADERLRTITAGGSETYHTDGLGGSTRLLTDALGAPTDTMTYDAFGEPRVRTGASTTPYLYRGERLDPLGEQVHLRARWMDPRLGRFASGDPYAAGIDDVRNVNRYLYAANDPVNRADPTGLFSLSENMATLSTLSILATIALPAFGGTVNALTGGGFGPDGGSVGLSITVEGSWASLLLGAGVGVVGTLSALPIAITAMIPGSGIGKALEPALAKAGSAFKASAAKVNVGVVFGAEMFAHAGTRESGAFIIGPGLSASLSPTAGYGGISATVYSMFVWNIDSLDHYASTTATALSGSVGPLTQGAVYLGGKSWGYYAGLTLGTGGGPWGLGVSVSGSTFVEATRSTDYHDAYNVIAETMWPWNPGGWLYGSLLLRRLYRSSGNGGL